MNCTFKYRAHSWLQILEVKLKKQRLETISINSWKRAFRLCFIKQVFTRALSWGAAAFYGKTKSAKINMMQRKFFKNLKFWFWRGLYSCGCFPSSIYSSKIKVNSLSAISAWQRALQNRLIISSSWTCQKYVGSFACN